MQMTQGQVWTRVREWGSPRGGARQLDCWLGRGPVEVASSRGPNDIQTLAPTERWSRSSEDNGLLLIKMRPLLLRGRDIFQCLTFSSQTMEIDFFFSRWGKLSCFWQKGALDFLRDYRNVNLMSFLPYVFFLSVRRDILLHWGRCTVL